MPTYRINNIKAAIETPEKEVLNTLRQTLPKEIENLRLVKKSLDARNKNNLHFIYAAEFVSKTPLSDYDEVPATPTLSSLAPHCHSSSGTATRQGIPLGVPPRHCEQPVARGAATNPVKQYSKIIPTTPTLSSLEWQSHSSRDPLQQEHTLAPHCHPSSGTATRQGIPLGTPPHRPIIVGSGPAGMMAALILAEAGLKPIIIERGASVEDRQKAVNKFWQTGELNEETNVQFGEGGAGTFSDGKLMTGIKKDQYTAKVLEEFALAGAPKEILYLAKPHIGTDKLVTMTQNIRKKIIALGGEYRFNTKLTDIIPNTDGTITIITESTLAPHPTRHSEQPLPVALPPIQSDNNSHSRHCEQPVARVADTNPVQQYSRIIPPHPTLSSPAAFPPCHPSRATNFVARVKGSPAAFPLPPLTTDTLILALGHSARDTFKMLFERGVQMSQKPFSVGVRIEHKQSLINLAQYGKKYCTSPYLGAADYKLATHLKDNRTLYTFCMCPGGVVVGATSLKDHVVTNGMSEFARDKENANAALLVNVDERDFGSPHPLAGIAFQEELEKKAFELGGKNYHAPVQTVGDFLTGKPTQKLGTVRPTYLPGVTPSDFRKLFPKAIYDTLQQGIIEMDKKLRGFADKEAVLTAVESRSSSPVRIYRDENNESNIKGLYPIGEGAGYAGGITSAATDGVKTAYKILMRN